MPSLNARNREQRISWAKQLVHRYPELKWLTKDSAQTTNNDLSNANNHGYSNLLFNKSDREFDRTVLSLEIAERLMSRGERSYLWLTQKQKKKGKLTLKTLRKLLSFVRKTIRTKEDEDFVKLLLVLRDVGKSPKARRLHQGAKVVDSDHHSFFEEAIRLNPQIFPSFNKLSNRMKFKFRRSPRSIHFGQITQMEGGLNMFDAINRSGTLLTIPKAIDLKFTADLFSFAGALAHKSSLGSLTLTEHKAKAFITALDIVKTLPSTGSRKAFETYQGWLAKELQLYTGTAVSDVTCRLAAMLRIETPREAAALYHALMRLKSDELRRMTNTFDRFLGDWKNVKTPLYLSEALSNLYRYKEPSSIQAKMHFVLHNGVLPITRILESAGRIPTFRHGQLTLNFRSLAKALITRPHRLKQKLVILGTGEVQAL